MAPSFKIECTKAECPPHRTAVSYLNPPFYLLSGENKMTTQGLLGFRYNDIDKLTYNHADSGPDTLGFRVLKELHAVDD
jgi:hypothetical protein